MTVIRPIPALSRGDPFGRVQTYRDVRAAKPDYEGLSDLGTQRIAEQGLASGATTVYSCPANRRARSGGGLILFHNATAGGITVDLHHVPSGGAAGATNKLLPTKTVAVDETWIAFDVALWQVLMSGEALVANTGGAGLSCWTQMLEAKDQISTYYGGFYADPDGTDRTLLTVPGRRNFALKSIHAYNDGGAARTLTINLRELGVAASDDNEVVATSINDDTAYDLDCSHLPTLTAGGVVSARGSASGISVWANGTLW